MKRFMTAMAAFGLMAGVWLTVPTQTRAQDAQALSAACNAIPDAAQKQQCISQVMAGIEQGDRRRATETADAEKKARAGAAMGEKERRRRN